MVDALREQVAGHAQRLKKRLKRAEQGDPDGVHDSRTTLRRLRSELDLMGHTVFDAAATARLCSELHSLERALAKARDTDVLAADLRTYTRRHRQDERRLRPLADRLAARRERAVRAAKRAIGPKVRRAVIGELCALLQRDACVTDRPPKNPAKAVPRLVRHFTHEEVWRRYDALRAYDARLPGSVETLHKMRAACRQMRFAIEAFAEALPKMDSIVRELHAIQDEIGTMHDHQVAIDLLERWRDQNKIEPGAALERYLDYHAGERDKIRARFQRRWVALLGSEFRQHLARALEVEAPPVRPILHA